MKRFLLPLLLLGLPALAQDPPPPTDEFSLPAVARGLLAAPADDETRFRIALLAGENADALATLKRLIAGRAKDPSLRPRVRDLQYLIYAMARLDPAPFDTAYPRAFHAVVDALDDRAAALVVNGLSYDNLSAARQALSGDLLQAKGKAILAHDDAVQLVHDGLDASMYGAIAPLLPPLIAADDGRRYVLQRDVVVPVSDGATVCALVMRPRNVGRLPALLEFTIYDNPGAVLGGARRDASNAYAAVVGLTRGKGCGSGPIIPYEHDGADAATLIDWIAKQDWSDGRVGMHGGSYSGFTPWAAAKHRPKALKAIMAGAPAAPAIDEPMEGNVVWNFIYPWPFYTTNNKTLDDATYGDHARWAKLDHDWYASGRRYRDLDKIDGTPNPLFDRWLDHPTYDAYWQSMIPYRREFATLNIAVLQTEGYYFGGPGSANYYFSQYQRYAPRARNYLVAGPYEHFLAQRGTAGPDGDAKTISGYALDPAALTDFTELRYRWFDYVLKGGPKPALLAAPVNYEVTGADTWKHAASLAAMARGEKRYYLGGGKLGERPGGDGGALTIDFKDRSDLDRQAPGGNVDDDAIDTANALMFESAPLTKPIELSGLFSGAIAFVADKKDFDLQVTLYEKTAAGRYIQLAPYWTRVSFAADPSHRHLLVPGKPSVLRFTAIRLMSRRLAVGSRIVAVVGVIKETGREINYGTGGTVADETTADAGAPLHLRLLRGSFLAMPLGR